LDTREWVFVLTVIAFVVTALVWAAKWRSKRFDDVESKHYGDDD